MKKVMSLLLVIALCLSMGTIAFAEEESEELSGTSIPLSAFGQDVANVIETLDSTGVDEELLGALRTYYEDYASNYTYNIGLAQPSGYIMGQDTGVGSFRVGEALFGTVGCEIAATYNALRAIGETRSLPSIIRSFEMNGYIMKNGDWGSDPFAIGEYFDSLNVDYEVFKEQFEYNTFKSYVENNGNDNRAYIVSFFNSKILEVKIHTVMFTVTNSGKLRVYNISNKATTWEELNSLDELIKGDVGMDYRYIVGYAIK